MKVQNAKYQYIIRIKKPENGLVTLADLLVLPHTKESPSDPIHTAKQFIINVVRNTPHLILDTTVNP